MIRGGKGRGKIGATHSRRYPLWKQATKKKESFGRKEGGPRGEGNFRYGHTDVVGGEQGRGTSIEIAEEKRRSDPGGGGKQKRGLCG